MLLSLLITVLLLIGFLLLSDITVSAVRRRIIGAKDYSVKTISDLRSNRKLSMRRQVELLTGKQRGNALVQNFSEARLILLQSGRGNRVRFTVILSTLLGVAGALVSLLLGNWFLIPTLSVGLFMLPSWYIKVTENYLHKHLNTELEVALSTITTSYVRSENLVQAVEENLKYLNAPVKQVFTQFVNENKLINSNIVYGLMKMKGNLDSRVFHEWCDAVIQCQSDRTLKATLFPIVNKFSELKAIQDELDTLLMLPLRDFILVSLIVFLSIPFMYFLNKEWFFALVGTVGGKLVLGLVSLCFFFGLNKAITLSKAIEYRR